MVSYDGNGNVVALHNAADGVESAAYEYGPFSEPIRVTGPVARLMPLRFSTMYEDNVTGDRKYLFRDYTPTTGRWKSRDPIEEDGGSNLYAFTGNSIANLTDPFGLAVIRLGIGFDSSVRADKATIGFITESQLFLMLKLRECSEKMKCECGGDASWDDASSGRVLDYLSKNKPAPKDLDYNLDQSEDDKLRNDNLSRINVGSVTVRILFTGSAIHQTWLGEEIAARATTSKEGILINPYRAVVRTIAHELGHVGGYSGDAPGDSSHAKDPDNLMHAPSGTQVDCEWCRKVIALAK